MVISADGTFHAFKQARKNGRAASITIPFIVEVKLRIRALFDHTSPSQGMAMRSAATFDAVLACKFVACVAPFVPDIPGYGCASYVSTLQMFLDRKMREPTFVAIVTFHFLGRVGGIPELATILIRFGTVSPNVFAIVVHQGIADAESCIRVSMHPLNRGSDDCVD